MIDSTVAGAFLTRQALSILPSLLEYVQQAVEKTGLFFGLFFLSVPRLLSVASASNTHMFEVELGLLSDSGICVQGRPDPIPQTGNVHDGDGVSTSVWYFGDTGKNARAGCGERVAGV